MPPITPSSTAKIPKLKVRVDDLTHAGVKIFFNSVDPKEVLLRAIDASVRWLYTPETVPTRYIECSVFIEPMGAEHE